MRKCKHCGNPLQGRSDKVFCSVKCKNDSNYAKRNGKNSIIEEVDGILHRNHDILTQIFQGEKSNKIKVPRLLLDKMGFKFNYHTGIYTNRQEKTYHYIYDFAWMEFSMQEILLIRRN